MPSSRPSKWTYNDQGRLVAFVPFKADKVKKTPKPLARPPACPDCGGSGSTQDGGMFSQFETCERCHGTGLKSRKAIKQAVEKRERAELRRLLAKYPNHS